MSDALKLRAEDAEDLRVIAACLQDALVPLSEIQYSPADQRVLLIANRFRWENCADAIDTPPAPDPALAECASYERVNCSVCFDNISAVRQKGLDARERGRILDLLTMNIEETDNGRMVIVMLFAGDGAIRLEGEKIRCRMGDMGEPWPTQWRPHHPTGDV